MCIRDSANAEDHNANPINGLHAVYEYVRLSGNETLDLIADFGAHQRVEQRSQKGNAGHAAEVARKGVDTAGDAEFPGGRGRHNEGGVGSGENAVSYTHLVLDGVGNIVP